MCPQRKTKDLLDLVHRSVHVKLSPLDLLNLIDSLADTFLQHAAVLHREPAICEHLAMAHRLALERYSDLSPGSFES